MAQTQQQAAIRAQQMVVALNKQLLDVYAAALPLLLEFTDMSYSTTTAAFPTAVEGTDGSIGAADGSPNVAHPITIPAGNPLNNSANALAIGLQNLTDLKAFMENVAVSASFRRAAAQNLQ
jgi:hypothetical protein